MKKTAFLKLVLTAKLLSLLLAGSCFGQYAQLTARQTAKAFYRFHFQRADRMFFAPENVHREKRWLTPKLYRLMRYEFRREAEYAKTHPTDKPYFDGDVFTNSQELPQRFRVKHVKEGARRAVVSVWVYWDGETTGKRIRVVFLKSHEQWLIDNLLYDQSDDLVKQLSRPNYQ